MPLVLRGRAAQSLLHPLKVCQGLSSLSLLRGHLCLWLRARDSTDLAEHGAPLWELL